MQTQKVDISFVFSSKDKIFLNIGIEQKYKKLKKELIEKHIKNVWNHVYN